MNYNPPLDPGCLSLSIFQPIKITMGITVN